MGKLSGTQIEEYFNEHLPYRNQVLLAHKNLCDKGPYNGDPAILRACFEASLVTGRMYLNMLGISMDKNRLAKKQFRHSDEISAEKLFPEKTPEGLLSHPINVISDHDHLFHAHGNIEFVEKARKQAPARQVRSHY